MSRSKKSSYSNDFEAETEHTARLDRLSPVVRALGIVLQHEVDQIFGYQKRFHTHLDKGPGWKVRNHFVFASMIALHGLDAVEVRIHLGAPDPPPRVETPYAGKSDSRREGTWVHHYRPERLKHLLELTQLLREAHRIAESPR